MGTADAGRDRKAAALVCLIDIAPNNSPSTNEATHQAYCTTTAYSSSSLTTPPHQRVLLPILALILALKRNIMLCTNCSSYGERVFANVQVPMKRRFVLFPPFLLISSHRFIYGFRRRDHLVLTRYGFRSLPFVTSNELSLRVVALRFSSIDLSMLIEYGCERSQRARGDLSMLRHRSSARHAGGWALSPCIVYSSSLLSLSSSSSSLSSLPVGIAALPPALTIPPFICSMAAFK